MKTARCWSDDMFALLIDCSMFSPLGQIFISGGLMFVQPEVPQWSDRLAECPSMKCSLGQLSARRLYPSPSNVLSPARTLPNSSSGCSASTCAAPSPSSAMPCFLPAPFIIPSWRLTHSLRPLSFNIHSTLTSFLASLPRLLYAAYSSLFLRYDFFLQYPSTFLFYVLSFFTLPFFFCCNVSLPL